MAAQGLRNMDQGEERIEDAWLRSQLRRRARRVYAEGLIVALVLTLLILIL